MSLISSPRARKKELTDFFWLGRAPPPIASTTAVCSTRFIPFSSMMAPNEERGRVGWVYRTKWGGREAKEEDKGKGKGVEGNWAANPSPGRSYGCRDGSYGEYDVYERKVEVYRRPWNETLYRNDTAADDDDGDEEGGGDRKRGCKGRTWNV